MNEWIWALQSSDSFLLGWELLKFFLLHPHTPRPDPRFWWQCWLLAFLLCSRWQLFLVFHVEFRILQAEAVVLRLGNVYPTLFIFSSLCMCLTCCITLLPEKPPAITTGKNSWDEFLVNRFSSPPTRNSPALVAFPRPYKTRLCKQRKSSLKWWAVLLVNGQTTMTLAHRMVEGFFFLSSLNVFLAFSLCSLSLPPSSLFTWNEGLWRQWPQYHMHAKMNGSEKCKVKHMALPALKTPRTVAHRMNFQTKSCLYLLAHLCCLKCVCVWSQSQCV